ncbi:MAG: uroporphyrinogen-III synthase, partial [Lachnospiraceae bacterium]|nr:uroporphyrinogen-III synthase [Lachnospiraceae bacterium]
AVHLAKGLACIIAKGQPDEGQAPCPAIFLRAKQGSGMLPQVFRKQGIPYTEYALYELAVREKKRDAVIGQEPNYIVFGSAMGARAYFEGLEKNGIQNTKSRFVCIGEWCAKEVQKYVTKPPLTAKEPSVDAIAECLCTWNHENQSDGTVREEEKHAPVQKTEEG